MRFLLNHLSLPPAACLKPTELSPGTPSGSSSAVRMDLPLPGKQDFLKQLEGLTYEERAGRAAQLGHKFKSSPELDKWIAEMRNVRIDTCVFLSY